MKSGSITYPSAGFADHLLQNEHTTLDNTHPRNLGQRLPGAVESMAVPMKWTGHTTRDVSSSVVAGTANFVKAIGLSLTSLTAAQKRLKTLDGLLAKQDMAAEDRRHVKFACLVDDELFNSLEKTIKGSQNVLRQRGEGGAVEAALVACAQVSAATSHNLYLYRIKSVASKCKEKSESTLQNFVSTLPEECAPTEKSAAEIKNFCLRHPDIYNQIARLREKISSQYQKTQIVEQATPEGAQFEMQPVGSSSPQVVLTKEVLGHITNAIRIVENLPKKLGADYEQPFVQKRIFQSLVSSPSVDIESKLLAVLESPSSSSSPADLQVIKDQLTDPVVSIIEKKIPDTENLSENWKNQLEWALHVSPELESAVKESIQWEAPLSVSSTAQRVISTPVDIETLVNKTIETLPENYHSASRESVAKFNANIRDMLEETRYEASSVDSVLKWAVDKTGIGTFVPAPYDKQSLSKDLEKDVSRGNWSSLNPATNKVYFKDPSLVMCIRSIGEDNKPIVQSGDWESNQLLQTIVEGHEEEFAAIVKKILAQQGDKKGIFVKVKQFDKEEFKETYHDKAIEQYRAETEVDGKVVSGSSGMAMIIPMLSGKTGKEQLSDSVTVAQENGESKHVFDHFADAPIYEATSDHAEISNFFNQRLNDTNDEKMRTLKARLCMVQSFGEHCFESLDLIDTIKGMRNGAVIGGGGGRLADAVLPHPQASEHGSFFASFVESFKSPLFWTNELVVQPGLDYPDNLGGEQGSYLAALGRKGLDDTREARLGYHSLPPKGSSGIENLLTTAPTKFPADNFRRHVALLCGASSDGPAASDYKKKHKAAALGTGVGVLLGTIQNHEISTPHPSLSTAIPGTMLATLGTAASIVFLIREQFADNAEAIKELIRNGKIPMPDGQSVDNDEHVQALAEKWALIELLTSLGSKTRMASYPTATLVATLWLCKLAPGAKIEGVKAAIQSLSATAENLACTGFLGYQLAHGYPNAQKKLKKMAYESARTGKAINPDEILSVITDWLSSSVAMAFRIDRQDVAKKRIFGEKIGAGISTATNTVEDKIGAGYQITKSGIVPVVKKMHAAIKPGMENAGEVLGDAWEASAVPAAAATGALFSKATGAVSSLAGMSGRMLKKATPTVNISGNKNTPLTTATILNDFAALI